MTSKINVFKTDLDNLIRTGNLLDTSLKLLCYPEEVKAQIKEFKKEKADDYIKNLPIFENDYQRWYSEALALIRQVLPDRVADFCRHYEKPKNRREITYENYTLEDCLQGLRSTRGGSTVADRSAGIPHFQQQLSIVKAAQARFDSSLFDIRQMVQADLLDSELDAAEHLTKAKFLRAAGAVAGVVLERHLGAVCADRKISIAKKNPTISDFNDALKAEAIIEVPQWRFIQHLADIRNICDHAKAPDPTIEQVTDLLAGVKKVIKTVF